MIVTIASQKGGVGKTTTCVNLAAALAMQGERVLAADLDPQCSLTRALAHDGTDDLVTVNEGTERAFDLLVGDPTLASNEPDTLTEVWDTTIRDLAARYGIIIIDTPPALSMLTMAAIYCADHVIAPTTPSFISAVGLRELESVIGAVNGHAGRDTGMTALLTMTERNGAAREMERQVRESFDCYQTTIRKGVAVLYAQAAGLDVISYDARSNVARDYLALAREMTE